MQIRSGSRSTFYAQTGLQAIQSITKTIEKLTYAKSSSNEDSSNSFNKKTVFISITKTIGQGSFGTVYLGKNEAGEIVAVKSVLQDPKYKNREFKIMRKLSHPFIIKLKNCFSTHSDTNELYLNLVMDYFPESLYSYIKSLYKIHKQLSDLHVKLYFYQLLRSLLYLQSLGIVHRDIKPQNILVDPSRNLVNLCDFGSAKILVPNEPNISYICSRFYRAPELIMESKDYTHAIDIWSISCVFVEMMIVKPLFPGQNSTDQLLSIFKILGTPTTEVMLKMNPHYSEVTLPQFTPIAWNKIIQRPLHNDIIDLLNKLFLYDPKHRLTAIDSLLHPYFDELRDPDFVLPNNEPYPDLFTFTTDELTAFREQIPLLMPKKKKMANPLDYIITDGSILEF